MSFNVHELIHSLSLYVWPMIRVSGFVLTLPVISSATTPVKIRLVFSLFLVIIIAPLHPEWPSLLAFSKVGVLGLFKEFFIGLLLGFTIQLVFQSFIVGGQVIAMQAGLGFATMVDPATKMSVPLISQLYLLLVTLLFLILDGHLFMIELLVKSFELQPLGKTTIGLPELWQLIMFSGWIFKGALIVSLPAVISLLVVSLSFGVMTKAAPQINIFSIGFPLTVLLGIIIVYVSLSSFFPHAKSILAQGLHIAQEMIQ